jgi:hypothetical protein
LSRCASPYRFIKALEYRPHRVGDRNVLANDG